MHVLSSKTQSNSLDITKLYGFTPIHFNTGNGGMFNVVNTGFITGAGAMSAIISNGKNIALISCVLSDLDDVNKSHHVERNIVIGNLNTFAYIIVIRDSASSYRLKFGFNSSGVDMGDIQFLSIMEYRYCNYGSE